MAAATWSQAQNEQPSPDAVTFKTLVKFDGTNGGNPFGNLVQGLDGDLYGTTSTGGTKGGGTVFKITPAGSLTVLYNFCAQANCTDGSGPNWVLLGTDGNFYGTTGGGGTNLGPFGFGGAGTVFKITPGGSLTTVYDFCAQPNCLDGGNPAGLLQGTDGNFYGGTTAGGNSTENGVIFKITPTGAATTLYTFCSQTNCTDGGSPGAALIQVGGNFYGTAQFGGAFGGGTVFKVSPKGALTTVYSFCAQASCSDGTLPRAPLFRAANGNIYGTAQSGSGLGGTIFKITPASAFSVLYSFCSQPNCADGANPDGGVAQATDGSFYGTTNSEGTNTTCAAFPPGGCGTVFKVTPAGVLTTLHDFDGTDGEASFSGIVQATNGVLYGMTFSGGTSNSPCYVGCGTVFSVSAGLKPFVELLPRSGKAGMTIQILGSNLAGATAVSFNGTTAAFTVNSKTLITATVPTGATTGYVTVTTSRGALKSNVRFQVRP
jgi:uncharacterized repeat protein (TIGR03803 family)